MINVQLLRDPAFVDQLGRAAQLKRMNFDANQLSAAFEDRRKIVGLVDDARARQKSLSKGFRDADDATRASLQAQLTQISDEVKSLTVQLNAAEERLQELALRAPSIPDAAAPVGVTDEDNEVIRHWGEPRRMDPDMVDHVELARQLGLVEFDRAQKFAGSRSIALTGNGALLTRAVLAMALDLLTVRGFRPVMPPVLVREEAMVGTGYFPLGVEDAYKADREDRYLVGTSEVSLVSLHRDELLSLSDLPIRYAGISSCFRREAGSHGRDTRGLYRVHQFDKVEQVSIIEADDELSAREQLALLDNSETVLKALELPHRVAIACTGEMGQGQRLKYEVETWMPSRGAYSETHSCSSFGDFQSRRSNIKYRTSTGETAFAYTLNNTAVAAPRILIPLLEHHQQSDGSVRIPTALRPYLNGLSTLTAETPSSELVPTYTPA
ncbi:serine--tRNA ligase [Micromonospora sp. WMMD1120]|uniref:serine--tRNA ligase n=1 Tax=Micromonospora sp. WMMD1120 TaxID=3016106 RepID=UPI002417C6ED|nr:serine--tRNA ligase [Micromonospora sp. WMMD1120]MDG4807196.1 serine--tRNA ligase [Micromonospora sp. WMMD1120]